MPPTESTKTSEFVFRRLGESFPQFMTDLWQAVPLWLLVLVALILTAKVGYGRYVHRTRGPGKPDATENAFWWLAFLSVAALVVWVLVAFYHRDTEQVKAGSTALSELGSSNNALWYAFVGGIFALGTAFTVLMYIKDARAVRWFWATKLAVLRISVYAILCFVFLLPAKQTWDRTEKKSRVVVLIDITPSLTKVTDEIDAKGRKPKTRMDVLIEFLTDDNVKLIQRLLEKNPLYVYPFGTRLDEAPQVINRDEKAWGKLEWEAFSRYDFRPFLTKGLSDAGREAIRNSGGWDAPNSGSPDWAASWFARKDEGLKTATDEGKPIVKGMTAEDDTLLRENITKLDRRIDVARTIALGTNVPDSITAAVNRESANMVEGMIVFSDGRSNLGTDSSYRELRDRAGKEKIPVFTVAVGEDRQSSSITITDIVADDSASPDQGIRVEVQADGVNLANKSVDVELDVYGPDKDPKDTAPDFTFKAGTAPNKAPYQLTFAPGDPPHGQIEFMIDPAKLAEHPDGAKLTEESKDAAIKKPVLKEGKWAVRARIPKHADEAFTEPEHVRDRLNIQVIQKKLRVLLMASAPNREFQFLRTFLVREVQDNRAEVTILVQNEAGLSGLLTPNATEQIISRFPTYLDLSGKKVDPKEKQLNLNQYDLIVAMDPDWTEVSREQAENLQTWVQRQGGGLIYVADRINTYQLARVEMDSRLSPILDILPVVPDDVIAIKIKPIARNPRRLYLDPIQGSDLLQIDDKPIEGKADAKLDKDPVAGWERFFTDRDKYAKSNDDKLEYFPNRGFFSCYPLKQDVGVKPGAKVLAQFAEMDERGAVTLRPWLVTNNPSAAWRTCFVGSGEVYRMYAYDREYYERYWAKLMKYMAAKRNVKASRGRVLVSKEYISGAPIRVQAQILNTTSKPYPVEGGGAIDPKFSIVQVSPTGDKKVIEGAIQMSAKPGGGTFDGYYVGQISADPKKFPVGDFEYQAVIEVPDSAGETLQGKFTIVKSDPEMDNTKPDPAAMMAMASEFDAAFEKRLPPAVRDEFKKGLPKDGATQRLKFDLSQKELLKLIPECFKEDYKRADIRGPVTDLWDKSVDFPERKDDGTFAERNVPPSMAGTNLKVSWVLLLVVGLLCWEWMTRKLLRLA